jgi:cell wall-associated NlpC family hydrolase
MKNYLIFFSFLFLLSGLNSCGGTKNIENTNRSRKYLLNKAYKKYKGVPYRYGGTTSVGFDCSGFTQRVYSEFFHYKLPRTTKAMMKTGKKISKKQLKPGDLVFFHPSRKYYHVGIYIGDGAFIHASTSRGVIKSLLSNSYWKKKYIFSRRVLK